MKRNINKCSLIIARVGFLYARSFFPCNYPTLKGINTLGWIWEWVREEDGKERVKKARGCDKPFLKYFMSWILFSSLSDSFPSIPLKPFFPLTSSLWPLLLFLCCTSAANLQIPPFIWINVFLMRTAHYLLLFCGIDLLTLLLPAHQQDLSSDHFSFPSCSSQKTLRTHTHAHARGTLMLRKVSAGSKVDLAVTECSGSLLAAAG